MEIMTFTKEEFEDLKRKDEKLSRVMDLAHPRVRYINPNLFETLVKQIIGQQISLKSAATIGQRFEDCFGTITPENILASAQEEMRPLGVSSTKARWIYEAAEKFQEDLEFYQHLSKKSNEEIRSHLLTFNGVGPWTVDMLLIFSIGRKDILSYEDLGVRNGLMKLYGLEKITKKDFQAYQEKFSPLGTLASLYFWEVYSKDLLTISLDY